jgi:two-component system response regulator YesN
LSGNDLAQKFFYNPSYFSRVFKEKFGMPFVEYITRKRLSYAIELLKNTELSVEEIGRRVGFSDAKGLYRAFSTYLGSTPSQYRAKT